MKKLQQTSSRIAKKCILYAVSDISLDSSVSVRCSAPARSSERGRARMIRCISNLFVCSFSTPASPPPSTMPNVRKGGEIYVIVFSILFAVFKCWFINLNLNVSFRILSLLCFFRDELKAIQTPSCDLHKYCWVRTKQLIVILLDRLKKRVFSLLRIVLYGDRRRNWLRV